MPTGEERDPAVEAALALTGFSRWQPVAGRHKVQLLHEGGTYDTTRFKVVKGAWDHEHCKRCVTRIESMTLCFVTTSGPTSSFARHATISSSAQAGLA